MLFMYSGYLADMNGGKDNEIQPWELPQVPAPPGE